MAIRVRLTRDDGLVVNDGYLMVRYVVIDVLNKHIQVEYSIFASENARLEHKDAILHKAVFSHPKRNPAARGGLVHGKFFSIPEVMEHIDILLQLGYEFIKRHGLNDLNIEILSEDGSLTITIPPDPPEDPPPLEIIDPPPVTPPPPPDQTSQPDPPSNPPPQNNTLG